VFWEEQGVFLTLNGATLYPLDVKSEGLTGLLNLLIEDEITVYHSVTTLFRYLANTLTGVEKFPKLRLIILGGEPVLRREVTLYEKYFSSDCLLSTGLGSTETGTARVFLIDKKTEVNSNMMPPLGYEVEDKDILLLDDAGAEVDLGDIGEIAVKSRYLALGYWQNPTLTQAAFVPEPAGGSERIYRTGDLGRMLPDGCLVHLGRKDFQVKIRGYRIELAEIEMALIDTGTLKEAIVLAREDSFGEKRLIAYVVPNQAAPSIHELYSFLIERLPDYMLPSTFVFLDTLPLTPGGKVDRRALPAPDKTRPDLKTTFVAPSTPVEKRLAGIWAEVLNKEPVGIHDNFFELGGNSLLATQVISRISDALSVALPRRSLFETPTLAGLADQITQQLTVAHDEMAELLAELEGLSEEDAQRLVAENL
jgi:acyl-coenzyme A synthetase/AMP-(fatty) acid ligase/acyl carrier protein